MLIKVIENCADKTRKSNRDTTEEYTSNPIYEIYERTGEVSEEEALGKKGGEEICFGKDNSCWT